jgi:hypothetical protein
MVAERKSRSCRELNLGLPTPNHLPELSRPMMMVMMMRRRRRIIL